MNKETLRKAIEDAGFSIVHEAAPSEERKAVNVKYDDLDLSERSLSFLKEKRDIQTLWSHQHKAIKLAKEGKNICVTTSTSSGKSEIFQVAAIENLEKNPGGKVLAVYPMKALTTQQLERWEKTGLKVQKIDGSVNIVDRADLLKKADVLVMTPDVIHAWLMCNINNRLFGGEAICDFIANISMVILDELHLYRGLFGSNCAYLFRRLNNVRRMLRKGDKKLPQYITASATLPDAVGHSFNITGAHEFIEIGSSDDGSPMRPKGMFFITPRQNSIQDLIFKIRDDIPESKSITFVSGREQTTLLSFDFENYEADVERTGIIPYRAGLPKKTVDELTKRMEDGDFRGIVSTTSLEIGIDIDGLNIVILANMPLDKNSYQQQIGRVGRFGCDGDSFVIFCFDERNVSSQLLFHDFKFDVDKVYPDIKPTLYLEDMQIMSVHAYCHVGYDDCEFNRWLGSQRAENSKFNDGALFPEKFAELCTYVIGGQKNQIYEKIISNCAGNDPHHTFSLRSFEKQYKVFFNDIDSNETLSKSQVAREAYPGAVRATVWGTVGLKQRVNAIDHIRSKILVSEVNNYARTSPKRNTYLIPNFEKNSIYKQIRAGKTLIINQGISEKTVVYGYSENKVYHKYKNGAYRNSKDTTGTLFFHPSLTEDPDFPAFSPNVTTEIISDILYETLLRCSAFDRSDMLHRGDKLYRTYGDLKSGTRYAAIYDDSEKFNLSKSLLDKTVLQEVFLYLSEHKKSILQSCLAASEENNSQNVFKNIENIIDQMCDDILHKDFEEIGETKWPKVLRNKTSIIYLQRDEEDPLNEEKTLKIPAIYVGIKNDGTPMIFVNGDLMDVDWFDIEYCKETEFEII